MGTRVLKFDQAMSSVTNRARWMYLLESRSCCSHVQYHQIPGPKSNWNGLEERSGTGAEGESDLGEAGGYTGLEI